MFTSAKTYDLNIQTEERRRQQVELIKKKIQNGILNPNLIKPEYNTKNIVQGTPAYAMSLKQRQQAAMYDIMNKINNAEENYQR
jgi:hypothetical protein